MSSMVKPGAEMATMGDGDSTFEGEVRRFALGGLENSGVVQSGGFSSIHIHQQVPPTTDERIQQAGEETRAKQRQKFHFDFLNNALKQAEWTSTTSSKSRRRSSIG